MKKLFNFKSIKAKILFGFSIVMAIVLAFCVFVYVSVDNIRNQSGDVLDKQLPLLLNDEYLSYNMIEIRAQINNYLLTGDQDVKKELEVVIDQGKEVEETALSLNNSEELKEVFAAKANYEASVMEAADLYDSGNEKEAIQLIKDKTAEAVQINDKINDMTVAREGHVVDNSEKTLDYANSTLIFNVVAGVLVLIVSVVVALLTSRTIANPIHEVMERMIEVSKGVLNLDPLEVKTNDETARLIESTNTMTEQNRELLQKIAEVSDTVSSQSEELTQSANEVKTGTEQIASTMQELASGSEMQANSTSELTDYMGTFSATIDETNNNSQTVRSNSEEVLQMTEEGSGLMRASSEQMKKIDGLVHNAIEKMNSLDRYAQDISKLVSVINDISEQTNLLALNAAIEAARAGEHGKGFAVVADEVRKLSEQVGMSIKDITGFVTNIQDESKNVSSALEDSFAEVEQGTEQIQTTEETFGRISNQVDDMVTNIQTVSDNLTEIVSNNEKMAKSIEEIASVSEESAAGVEQTAASAEQSSSSMEEVSGSSRYLAQLAEELNTLVSQYEL